MYKKLAFILFVTLACAATETRRKIAILDTGIDEDFPSQYLCSEGNKDFTGLGLHDYIKHGTHLAYIIKDYINPKQECLLILKFYDHTASVHSGPLMDAYRHLKTIDISFLNMSFGGEVFSPMEKETINTLLDKGVIISVAAGNNSLNLNISCDYYPACYKFNNSNFHVVASCDSSGKIAKYSNFNGPVTECNNGTKVKAGPYTFTGTSQSTAIQTGKNVENSHKSKDFHDR